MDFEEFTEGAARAALVALLWAVVALLFSLAWLAGATAARGPRDAVHATPDGCVWRSQDGALSPIIVDGRHVGCREE